MLPIINYMYTTKTSCFNHRVVTLVAVKLKDIGYERFTLVAQTNCIRLVVQTIQAGNSLTHSQM